MKRVIVVAVLLAVSLGLQAAGFSKQATHTPQLIQSGPQKMWCPVCGMNLKMFYKTSHAVELNDGTKKQYCSIRCLAADWKNIEGKVKKIYVVDAATEKLIDAKKAYYVVGSKVPGTMSRVSKIAFGSLKEAQAFRKRYGGKIVDFDTAFKMAADALGGDTAMISKKKKLKIYPMGEKIYKKMCQPVDVGAYGHINDLKAALKEKKLCKPMREKQLQAVALYLWDVVGGHADDALGGCGCKASMNGRGGRCKAHAGGQGCGCRKGQGCRCKKSGAKGCGCRKGCKMDAQKGAKGCACSRKMESQDARLTPKTAPVSGDETLSRQDKCPVCGMFVYKYPKWAAFIYYEKDGKLAHLAFDGVKDMMKFYFDPAKWGYDPKIKEHIKKMVVRDYYTLKPVWAKRAWYVVGSDVYGPMGNELVPFASKEAAENFLRDHHGKRVLSFEQISEALVYKLDE
ncbi:nitrous oxide reductase accessory protein NosL [Hydrogenimonas sp.]